MLQWYHLYIQANSKLEQNAANYLIMAGRRFFVIRTDPRKIAELSKTLRKFMEPKYRKGSTRSTFRIFYNSTEFFKPSTYHNCLIIQNNKNRRVFTESDCLNSKNTMYKIKTIYLLPRILAKPEIGRNSNSIIRIALSGRRLGRFPACSKEQDLFQILLGS